MLDLARCMTVSDRWIKTFFLLHPGASDAARLESGNFGLPLRRILRRDFLEVQDCPTGPILGVTTGAGHHIFLLLEHPRGSTLVSSGPLVVDRLAGVSVAGLRLRRLRRCAWLALSLRALPALCCAGPGGGAPGRSGGPGVLCAVPGLHGGQSRGGFAASLAVGGCVPAARRTAAQRVRARDTGRSSVTRAAQGACGLAPGST